MEIRDYETGKNLTDVEVVLTQDEAEELYSYLSRMLSYPDLTHVHLSQIQGCLLQKELSISLNRPPN